MPGATVSPAGMRVVRLLVGNPPRTVADLIKATGVTRTAVTEQLNELTAAGFVEQTIQRTPGRGRPRYLYATTDAALLLLFASNQNLVVPAVWHAIGQVGGEELTQKVLDYTSQVLADHYASRITGRTPAERLRQMTELLREEGVVAEVQEKNGHVFMHKRSCPFISMFEASRAVCMLDEQMLTRVVGRPVHQVACRHEGDPCCSFELGPRGRD